MNIRRATQSDSSILSSLNMDVQILHAEHHPKIFKIPESENFAEGFFAELLEDPTLTIFIAEENANPIGYVVCKLIDRPETPFTFAARTLLIDQISVRPTDRGKGVGTALMQQVERFAVESGAQRIHLDSWDFNLHAHAFFEHMGFQKFIFRFWKHL